VKTECMTLVVDGRRTHVDPKLDRSFLLFCSARAHVTEPRVVNGRWRRVRLQTEKTARSRETRFIRMAKHWIGDIGCCRRRVKDPRCILLARDPD